MLKDEGGVLEGKWVLKDEGGVLKGKWVLKDEGCLKVMGA